MPTAEIITIGTELLLGETADTNTRFIARRLREMGIDLFRTQMVGDNAGRIAEVVRQSMQRAEIIITTGGLGPTVDDPTRQAIADAGGVSLEFHPELWEEIVARIARYGRTPTENQKRQAFIPQGAIIIHNHVGTAPAFMLEYPAPDPNPSKVEQTPHPPGEGPGLKKGVIISLPGVPRELETLLTGTVLPWLQGKFDLHSVLEIRTLHVSGLGEGLIDDRIGDLELLSNPTVGLTAHSAIVDIRIAAKAGTNAEADEMIARLEADLRRRLPVDIFGADEETLEGVLMQTLQARGWSLACLEINLDGALLNRLAQNAHPFYKGGNSLPASSMDLKIATRAVGSEKLASASIGVVYSQGQDQQEINIFVHTPVAEKEMRLNFGGHPANARRWAANMALDTLRRLAQESSS